MIFDKSCGNFKLTVSAPSPSFVSIEHDGGRLSGMIYFDELHDLRFLIDRALTKETTNG